MSGKRYITVEQHGKKQAVPVKKRKNPYGVQRPIAFEEVQQLRDKGERARLVETNPKHKLYAAYEGVTGKDINKIVNSNTQPENNKVTMSQKLPFNKRVPEETIELYDEGTHPYIAELLGPDKNYHYQRRFIQQIKTYEGGSGLNEKYKTYFRGKLPYGAIIDTSEYSYIVVPKSPRHPNGLSKIGTEGMNNRVKMSKLFEARSKSGYRKKITPPNPQKPQ